MKQTQTLLMLMLLALAAQGCGDTDEPKTVGSGDAPPLNTVEKERTEPAKAETPKSQPAPTSIDAQWAGTLLMWKVGRSEEDKSSYEWELSEGRSSFPFWSREPDRALAMIDSITAETLRATVRDRITGSEISVSLSMATSNRVTGNIIYRVPEGSRYARPGPGGNVQRDAIEGKFQRDDNVTGDVVKEEGEESTPGSQSPEKDPIAEEEANDRAEEMIEDELEAIKDYIDESTDDKITKIKDKYPGKLTAYKRVERDRKIKDARNVGRNRKAEYKAWVKKYKDKLIEHVKLNKDGLRRGWLDTRLRELRRAE